MLSLYKIYGLHDKETEQIVAFNAAAFTWKLATEVGEDWYVHFEDYQWYYNPICLLHRENPEERDVFED